VTAPHEEAVRPPVPRAGACAGSAVLRSEPADFIVDECIELEAEDGGEHLWLRVRKTGENTEHVARLLAQASGIRPQGVGYAGRKDRHAVATQWFSLHLPGRPDPGFRALPPSVEILEARRRRRKLQVGGLHGNRFRIVLREFVGEAALLGGRLAELGTHGAPNYFGAQRFGRDGGNLAQALAWLRGERRVDDRKRRGLLLSAMRAQVFNAVLARRVAERSWCAARAGDALMLDGRGSFFVADDIDATLAARIARGELHPSGPLWGEGEPPVRGEVAALEHAVAAEYAEFAAGLARAGLAQERRALRVLPRELAWEWPDARTLVVSFFLPAGCFATTVLEEVLECRDAAAQPPSITACRSVHGLPPGAVTETSN
jgi:tRNA pseudouridine13 synthase